MAQSDYRRPILLSIIAILSVLGGLLVCVAGAVAITGGTLFAIWGEGDASTLGLGATALGVITLLLGILVVVVGVGLFSGKSWAWWLTVVVYGLSAILGIVMMVSTGNTSGLFGVLFAVLVLLYMNSKNTKGWFGI